MRRLVALLVMVTLFVTAGWLWSSRPHQRRAGGDADVVTRAPVPRSSPSRPRSSHAPTGQPDGVPGSREMPILREVPLVAGSGGGAEALAFDGASLWVASQFKNTLTRVRASDGATLGTVSVGSRPVAVLADASGIWVANLGDNTVTKLSPRDGSGARNVRGWQGAVRCRLRRRQRLGHEFLRRYREQAPWVGWRNAGRVRGG